MEKKEETYAMSSGDGLHTATSLLLATTFASALFFQNVGEEMTQHQVLRLREESGTKHRVLLLNRPAMLHRSDLHRVVDGIFVLFQPGCGGVGDGARVVMDLEMSFGFAFARLGFAELRMFAQMIVVEFLHEGLVTGFGNDTFFFQDGENAHGLSRASRSK